MTNQAISVEEEKSPIISPDPESGSFLRTPPKFVRNCDLHCQASRARITPRSPRLACYQCQTPKWFCFRKIGGLSDRPSRRMSGQFELATDSDFHRNLRLSNIPISDEC